MSDRNRFSLGDNGAACVFKWGWNTFRPFTGKSSSCHRVKPVEVPLNDFKNFHNTKEVLDDRQKMLEGVWPEGRGCEFCKSLEDAGGTSDRTYHNEIPNLAPIDFDHNKKNIEVTQSIQEVYLNNTCDLACTYCFPQFTSKYNAELKKYGPTPYGQSYVPRHKNHKEYLVKFMEWLSENCHKLTRLQIMGGEPFIQKEFWGVMEFLKKNPHPNLELSVTTNLNQKKEIYEEYLESVQHMLKDKKIKRADVDCSIDCWGPQQEFIRYGLNLERWQDNFEYVIKHKWLKISVHQVVTSLTLSTQHQLQEKITEYKNKINPKIYQAYHLVDCEPSEVYEPMIFGKNMFVNELNNLIDTYPIMNWGDRVSKDRLIGILKKQLASDIDKNRLLKLKTTLDMLDHRRNTNWKSLFPHIDQFFVDHKI